MLLIDDLGKRGILNEAEKKVLSSYIIRLSQNNTSADIELINKDLGALVDGLEKNSSNVEFIALASAMKKRVGDQRVVDPLPGSPVVIGEFTDAFKDMRSTGCMMIAVGGWGALGAGVGQVVCEYVQ